MGTKLRIAGWILFVGGAGYCGFLISQGEVNWKDPWTVAAAIAMPLGMACTTMATAIGIIQQRLRKPRMAQPEPEPDPNLPVKTYKVRPLEKEKLKVEEKKEGPPA